MDELSTFFHCSSKSYQELVTANASGVNMIPPAYFYLMWTIDNILGLDKIVMRIVPLLFGVLSIIICNKILNLYFDRETSILSSFTVLSHCPIFLFSICESRPYSLYLFLVLLLIYVSSLNTCRINFTISTFLNFLIPGTFYFGGIYCVSICFMVCVYKYLNKLPLKSYLFSCFAGWFLFLVFIFPTFWDQINSTYTLHLKSISYLHSSALFSLQGMQVYLPVSLVILVLISTKRINSFHSGFYLTFILISLLLVPILIFLICKIFHFKMFQERYFIPSLFFYIIFYCTLIHNFQIINLKKIFIKLHIFYCFVILTYLTSSYARAFNSDDFSDSLESLKNNDYPIFTFSRRVAFQLCFEDRSTYLIVADKNYSNHMSAFSKFLKPIPVNKFYSILNKKLSEFDKVYYIYTPWVNEDINQIKNEFLRYGISFEKIDIQRSNHINSIYSLSKN